METQVPIRVVSSGQVYRQMFDAQVQLTKEYKSSFTKTPHELVIKENSIPIVHKQPLPELLDKRQRTWCHSFPNDANTENPVLYKQFRDYVNSQFYLEENNVVARDVLNLPDVVQPAKIGSDIIQKITSARQKRHEVLYEDMLQQLTLISVNLEPRIRNAGELVNTNLRENDKEIQVILHKLNDNQKLLEYSRDDLNDIWYEVIEHRERRHEWIRSMQTTLIGVENDRINMVRSIFATYTEKLEKVAYILKPDLHRILDKEVQVINENMLSNKRTYGDLVMRMMCADIERERKQHSYWLRQVENWKLLMRDLYVKQFQEYMQSDDVQDPPSIKKMKEEMKDDLTLLNKHRLTLIDDLRKFKPPKCSKASIYGWNQQMVELGQQIDNLCSRSIHKLHLEYEVVCQMRLTEIDRIRTLILDGGIATICETDQLIADEFVPQIGKMQTKFEKELETMDNHTEVHKDEMSRRARVLYLYFQGVAHVWDTHEIGLARQERKLKEQLDACRMKHNNETHEREGLLDTYMDKMRQDSKEKLLAESLKRCKDILALLKMSYEQFYKDMCGVIDGYTEMVASELEVYDNSMCLYFGVRKFDETADKTPDNDGKSKETTTKTNSATKSADDNQADDITAEHVADDTLHDIVSTHSHIEDLVEDHKEVDIELQSATAVMSGRETKVSIKDYLPPSILLENEVLVDKDREHADDARPKSVTYEQCVGKFEKMKGSVSNERRPWDPDTFIRGKKIVIEKVESEVPVMKPKQRVRPKKPTITTEVTEPEVSVTKIVSQDTIVTPLLDEVALKELRIDTGSKSDHRRPSMVTYESTIVTEVPSWEEILRTSSGDIFFVLTEEKLKESVYGMTNTKNLIEDDMSFESFLNLNLVVEDKEAKTAKSAPTAQDMKQLAYVGEYLPFSEYDDTPVIWYLEATHLSEKLLLDTKKQVRLNLLDYLAEWRRQSIDRSRSVVAAKHEELYSELDLRLHLHAPRAQRAELDVHNVRAAELVMHSTRVKRHTQGIESALDDLIEAFQKAMEDHNTLAARFKYNIEELECVFINATKSAKLVVLQNEVGVQMKKYMRVIRASLREFRKYLDETLLTLRESNARFIKSFRVFSDGGNFSPSELEVYRHKLEKISHHIDKVEGDIMLELEGIESKRLEQASRVAQEFEGRFKYHMLDLLFMEKIARWLTNTQVNIKSEVAHSNKLAKEIAGHVKKLAARIDACERPNLDKEQITPKELNSYLSEIFIALDFRTSYLACFADEPKPDDVSSTITGPVSHCGTKVGFGGSDITASVVPTIVMPSTRAKTQIEEPSVATIKQILGREKAKSKPADDIVEFKLEPKERHRPYQPGTVSSQTTTSEVKPKAKGKDLTVCITAPSSESLRQRRPSKISRWERRFLVFGEDDDKRPSDFLTMINETLRIALDGLLNISDIFYKQKGTRIVTRPQALQENFDLCMEVLITKLLSYQKQAEAFHNQSLQEFRVQTYDIEKLVDRVPPLFITEHMKTIMEEFRQKQHEMTSQFEADLQHLHDQQNEHSTELRPILGHPQNQQRLQVLCEREIERQIKVKEVINKHMSGLKENLKKYSEIFMNELTALIQSQITQYDGFTIIDDLAKGDTETRRYPTCELIRRKNVGLPLECEDEKPELPRGKGTWAALPRELMSTGSRSSSRLGEQISSKKTTLGHSATIDARDTVHQKYKAMFENSLAEIKEESARRTLLEERWAKSWSDSVKSVKSLY